MPLQIKLAALIDGSVWVLDAHLVCKLAIFPVANKACAVHSPRQNSSAVSHHASADSFELTAERVIIRKLLMPTPVTRLELFSSQISGKFHFLLECFDVLLRKLGAALVNFGVHITAESIGQMRQDVLLSLAIFEHYFVQL